MQIAGEGRRNGLEGFKVEGLDLSVLSWVTLTT